MGPSRTSCRPSRPAAAGDPDIVAKLKKGHDIGGTTFKVHIDGYNLLPFLSGKEPCPRNGFIYWSDDGDLMALRVQRSRIVFAEQNAKGIPRSGGRRSRRCAFPSCSICDRIRSGGRGQHQVERLVCRARPVSVRRAGDRAPVARELRRVPTATKSGELHCRSNRRETDAEIVGPAYSII